MVNKRPEAYDRNWVLSFAHHMKDSKIYKLLAEYCRTIRCQADTEKPEVDYYLLARYIEGKTTSSENKLVAEMMLRDASLYRLIRDSRREKE